MLRLYNTLTRTIEDFQPQHPPVVTYYSCGPTVYDYAHIGHARTFVFADILERVLQMNGYEVKRVMNITDVGHLTSDSDEGEDKMEKGARREQKSVWDIATYYTDDFLDMLKQLHMRIPKLLPKATEYIPQMIKLIQHLEQKGYTYTTADGVYFDTSKFPAYGALTGLSFDELQKRLRAGVRVEQVEGKRHPTDFALWKRTPEEVVRAMEWDSPWGKGFPGWHIECSAMSMDLLGETLDIHTGGIDHVPIHHTNEIAQSEAATGKPFSRYWLHGEHLLIDGQKMSKSLGNFYRLKDLEEKQISPLALRYLFLTASYRKQMNFTWSSLQSAQQALQGLRDHIARIPRTSDTKGSGEYHTRFVEALNDDLNTAQALAVVWEAVKSDVSDAVKWDVIYAADALFDLSLSEERNEERIPEEMQLLLKKRQQLRKEKQWDDADTVRKTIEEKGYFIEDTPGGAKLRKKAT